MASKKEKFGIGAIIAVAVIALVIGVCWKGLVGYNSDQDWQMRQTVSGERIIQDRGGYYGQFFNTTWTYPRVQQAFFSSSVKEGGTEDDSIKVTFNDGGQAKISSLVRWQNPTSEDQRKLLHRAFSGNPKNIESAVRSALINVCKNTAPLMSASEHQSARKAEFAQLVETQLRTGMYKMERITSNYKNKDDVNGKSITIQSTKIVRDKLGNPIISQESPLKKYGLVIQQFSITGTDYDEQTRKQFSAKKDAYLKAELAKSQKNEEVQKRLQVVEKGLREKAEMEAKMNVEKIQAVIAAEKEKEVAQQTKLQAEIKAEQLLSVAEIEKKEAQIQLDKARLDAQAKIALAEAEQKKIELAGAIKEETKILAEIEKETRIGVAKALADGFGKATLPKIMNFGSGGEKSQAGTGGAFGQIMQLMVLDRLNEGAIVPKTPAKKK